MGTKAIVIIARKGDIVACAHRQRDGYPSGGTPSDVETLFREHHSADTARELIGRLNAAARKRPGGRRDEAALGACYEQSRPHIGWSHEWVYVVHLDRWLMIAGQIPDDVVRAGAIEQLVEIEARDAAQGEEAA